MIQLRIQERLPNGRFAAFMNLVGRKRSIGVLQQRTMINVEEIGIQEPLWSEWEDVSIEKLNSEEAP